MHFRRRIIALVLHALMGHRAIAGGEVACAMVRGATASAAMPTQDVAAPREHTAHERSVPDDHHDGDHHTDGACTDPCLPGACASTTHCGMAGDLAREASDVDGRDRCGPMPANDRALSSITRAPDPPPPRA